MKFFDMIISFVGRGRGVKVWGAENVTRKKEATGDKTYSFVTPMYQNHGSCIITDPRGKLADLVAILEKNGYSICYLDIDTKK